MTEALKKELIEAGYSWVDNFRSIDDLILEIINDLKAEKSSYNPFLVEKNLSSLATSLDKVHSLRSASNDLEDKAITQALEYRTFSQNTEIVKKLEAADWLNQQFEAEQPLHEKAAISFESNNHPLAKGFAATSQAGAEKSQLASDGEKERQLLVSNKWANVEAHQKALQERHYQPGHALNYGERSQRIQALIADETETMYFRARAVSAGLGVVFGFDESIVKLPDPKPAQDGEYKSYLEHLMLWARQAARALSIRKQQETLFEHTISIVQPMSNSKRLLEESEFAAAMDGDGKVVFNLKEYFPDEVGGLRLLGVALSMVHEYSQGNDWAKHRYDICSRAIVFPPEQINPYDTATRRPIAPIVINNITNPEPAQPPSFVRSPAFENINPGNGEWKIKIADYQNHAAVPDRRRTSKNTHDFRLHLLLASNFDTDHTNWDKNFWGSQPESN
ncbi:MAG: hypothetical protein AAGE37_03620 [Pseudomonadota bacterium]